MQTTRTPRHNDTTNSTDSMTQESDEPPDSPDPTTQRLNDPTTQRPDRPTLIHHFLENSAREYPEKVALIQNGLRVTYSQINRKADSLARYLVERGVQSGERIGILFENCLDYVVSYYAVLKTGAVAVPLNTDLNPESLRSILVELDPKFLISSSRFENVLEGSDLQACGLHELILANPQRSWNGAGYSVSSLEELLQNGSSPFTSAGTHGNSLASIIYTSGSTGRPKGVMLSHGNIVSNTVSICQYLKLTSSDIQMVVLPFFYVMGKSLLNTHFAVGGTVVINNKFAFPASVLNEMVTEKVTGFSGVPSTFAYLLHRSPLAKFRDKLTTLRYCSQAGGHMSRAVKEGLREVLPPHTDIVIMYGATEASARLSYLAPEHFKEKMDSIGKAIPGVTLRVLDGKGRDLGPGQVGELTAMGPNIMMGYWKDAETSRRVLNGNEYRTGDKAYRDSEGFYYVMGRVDNQVKVAGHRVNLQDVEDALMQSGMVIEAVVLALADELLGQKLVAMVVPRDKDCNVKDILASCAERLPRYKIPADILFQRTLPKNGSGKIDRQHCVEVFMQEQGNNEEKRDSR